jgi:hypothetical protein
MTGYLRQDDDCHWYFIPAKEIEKWDEIQDRMAFINSYSEEWEELNELFSDKFSQYMIDNPWTLKLKEVA